MIRLINMLFFALFAVSAHAIDLKSVRSSADQDSSRVVLEFSGKPQFSHFNLNNPSRWPTLGDASNPNLDNEYHIFYKEFIDKLVEKKDIKSIYSTFNNQENIFFNFNKNCKSSELVENFLYKLDLTKC